MEALRAGLIYFLTVFGAGFALAFVRIPFLVPAFGVRVAELIEAPVMLGVIIWASWRMARRHPALRRPARFAAGLSALVLLVVAELAVARFLGARSPGEYVASRDRVSGSVYLLSLMFFAVAPGLWTPASGPDD